MTAADRSKGAGQDDDLPDVIEIVRAMGLDAMARTRNPLPSLPCAPAAAPHADDGPRLPAHLQTRRSSARLCRSGKLRQHPPRLCRRLEAFSRLGAAARCRRVLARSASGRPLYTACASGSVCRDKRLNSVSIHRAAAVVAELEFHPARQPLDLKDSHIVTVMAGNTHVAPPRQRRPSLPENLIAMLDTLDRGTLRGLRDRAMLLLGFAGGLRRSEIVTLDVGRDQTEDGRGWIEILDKRMLVSLRGKTAWAGGRDRPRFVRRHLPGRRPADLAEARSHRARTVVPPRHRPRQGSWLGAAERPGDGPAGQALGLGRRRARRSSGGRAGDEVFRAFAARASPPRPRSTNATCKSSSGLSLLARRHPRTRPDAEVQAAARMLFTTFERLGSATRTVKFFLNEGILFPRRLRKGPRKGELMWAPPRHAGTLQVLHNPRYAGAFVYCRTHGRPRPGGGVSQVKVDMADWRFVIPTRTRAISTRSASRPTRSVSPPMHKPMECSAPPGRSAKDPPCSRAEFSAALAASAWASITARSTVSLSRPMSARRLPPPWRQGLLVRARQSRRPATNRRWTMSCSPGDQLRHRSQRFDRHRLPSHLLGGKLIN